MSSAALSALIVLGSLLSCGPPDSPTPTPPTAEPTAEPTAPPALPGIAEDQVVALVDGWLAAQNSGDFAAYQALYAERFTGIKRSGPRTYRFDLANWLSDRQSMFRRPMRVEAAELEVHTSSQMATATFSQVWQSGSYKDRGPKRLVIVRAGDQLRIAREEMLRSNILESDGTPRSSGRERLRLLLEADARYVVIEQGVDSSWATGPATLVRRGPEWLVVKSVDPGAIPDALHSWFDRRMLLLAAGDAGCESAVDGLYVMTAVTPHFGAVRGWTGDPELGSGKPASDQEIARDIWSMLGDDTRLLVARLRFQTDCTVHPQWARTGTTPVTLEAASADLPAELSTAILRRYRALEGHRAIQKDYDEGQAKPKAPRHWDQYAAARIGPSTRMALFGDPSRRALVAVHSEAGPGCGDFYGTFAAVFSVTPAADGYRLELLTDPQNPGLDSLPTAAVDLEGGGSFDLISPRRLYRVIDGTYREIDRIEFPDFDCPC